MRQALEWLVDCNDAQCAGTSKYVAYETTPTQNDVATKEGVVCSDVESDGDDKTYINNCLTKSLEVFRCNFIDGDELIRIGGSEGDGILHYDLRSSR